MKVNQSLPGFAQIRRERLALTLNPHAGAAEITSERTDGTFQPSDTLARRWFVEVNGQGH
jgi:hypothetical protein